MSKIISYIKSRGRILLHERKYKKRMKYMFFNNNADQLVIVFNGFGGKKPKYNYVRGLSDIKSADFLYILDDFGYTGSYLLFENGTEDVRILTENLLNHIVSRKNYKKIITAGSSKGGTCAIYFGLALNADEIYSAACQYNLGTYLHRPDHESIFIGMMGDTAGDKDAELLNNVMPRQLENYARSFKGKICLFYSKKDLTYERQLIDLINKLKACAYSFDEIESDFEKHDDVGIPFLKFLREKLQNE